MDNSKTWSDEQLAAYADGALDAAQVSALEAALEADAALAERVALMFETRELGRQAFDAQLDETPVPAALRASVEAMVAQDRAARARAESQAPATPQRRPAATAPRQSWWRGLLQHLGGGGSGAYALPAGALASVLFGTLGYLLGSGGELDGGGGGNEPAALAAVGKPAAPALAALLDRLPSGQQQANGPAQQAVVVAMVASYRDAGGALCRDFSVEPGQAPRVEAVACRAGEAGPWQVRFAALAEPDAPGGGFTPASPHSALDSYLASIGAGKPLDAAAERAALAGKK